MSEISPIMMVPFVNIAQTERSALRAAPQQRRLKGVLLRLESVLRVSKGAIPLLLRAAVKKMLVCVSTFQ